MTGHLAVRRASEEDLPVVLAILTSASDWERAHGIFDPWPHPFPAERVRPSLDRGEVYLGVGELGEAIATINLSWEDPRFWGLRPPDAGYVHRLAVRPDHAGESRGLQLLEWAAERVRSKGRAYLRLDCLASNRRLCGYYRDAGFEPRGTVDVDGFTCARFEKRVAGPASAGRAPHPIARS